MASVQEAPPARLKVRYLEEIRPQMISRFGYSSAMQAPKLEKITLNMGVGMAKTDSKVLRAATEQLATIAGQQPNVRRARKSIAAFKLREGNPVGVSVTLRGDRSYEFLDRLISIAIPRIRDFRGLNPRSFDGRGNYSIGVKEQIIFPEIDYDAIDQVRGLDITLTTSAATDAEAFALLVAFGLPFSAERRPKDFETPDENTPAGRAQAQADARAQAAADARAAAAEAREKAEASRAPAESAETEAPGEADEEPAAADAEAPEAAATDEVTEDETEAPSVEAGDAASDAEAASDAAAEPEAAEEPTVEGDEGENSDKESSD
jgi:large subunit ribosomal protein L5